MEFDGRDIGALVTMGIALGVFISLILYKVL
jgi:tetrahydromethanopterin S-methyltransferase subunit G